MNQPFTRSFLAIGALFVFGAFSVAQADDDDCDEKDGYKRVEVNGVGTHYFDSLVVHKSRPTENGLRQTATETIDLTGDLEGRVLYQPTSVIDYAAGTMVNTGKQVFSGTILGGKPVMIFDDEFRFDVNLFTGEVRGKVYLTDRVSGPKAVCELEVTGTAPPNAAAADFAYSGYCKIKRRK